MKEKKRDYLFQTIQSVILAGVILFFIGLYYCFLKAGIPYQDPTIELQIQYAVNMGIGKILLQNGFVISICGGIIRLITKLILEKSKRK